MALFVFVLGLVMGSFLAALTYRIPNEISISKGRSFCPKCKKSIKWFDNIPLLSYLILGGKCRNCGKAISKRYFLIELFSGILFLLTYLMYGQIVMNLVWMTGLTFLIGTLSLFVLVFLLMGVFIVDKEHQFIPDEFVFLGILVVFIAAFFSGTELIYEMVLAGLASSFFLLLIHLLTRGKGMGLGDVKLAILLGTVLGLQLSLVWMFLSFVLGSVVGIILLTLGSAKMKQRIAFGPFLVTSFFLTILFGNSISRLLFPYLSF